MADGGLYESVLRSIEHGAAPMPVHDPRASASVILWRRSDSGGLETYWVRRSPSLRFMGGWQGFPGGGVSRDDADIEWAAVRRGDGAPRDGGHAGRIHRCCGAARRNPGARALSLPRYESCTRRPDAPGRRGGGRPTRGPGSYAARTLDVRSRVLQLSNRLDIRLQRRPSGVCRTVDDATTRDRCDSTTGSSCSNGRSTTRRAAGDRPGRTRRWRMDRAGRGAHGLGIRRDPGGAADRAHFRVLAETGPSPGFRGSATSRKSTSGSLRRVEFDRASCCSLWRRRRCLRRRTPTAIYSDSEDCVLVDPGTPFEDEQERLIEALEAAKGNWDGRCARSG